jgi:hypothetical protein
MVLLAAIIFAVSQIFTISSDAANRTNAHSEIIEAAAAIHQQLTADLSKIAAPTGLGLLIIESPTPTLARVETTSGPRYFRLRQDRLVFVASGNANEYQSFTHRWAASYVGEDRAPPAGSQALLYFGPGIPVSREGTPLPFDDNVVALAASQWSFVRRAIVLLNQIPPDTDATWTPLTMASFNTGMLTNGPIDPGFYNNTYDAIVSGGGLNADANTLLTLIAGKVFPSNINSNPIASVWQPNLSPITASLRDPLAADYYTKSAFTFQPRLADFRIEWTDGRRVDPVNGNFNTRWFGLAPDPTQTVDFTNPDSLKFQARMRGVASAANPSNPNAIANPDNPPTETADFAHIEWSPTGVTSDPNAQYRAIWRGADYDNYKPRALRFTFRLYDAGNRLKFNNSTLDLNEDGVADVSGARTVTAARYGQEFSFVIQLP